MVNLDIVIYFGALLMIANLFLQLALLVLLELQLLIQPLELQLLILPLELLLILPLELLIILPQEQQDSRYVPSKQWMSL